MIQAVNVPAGLILHLVKALPLPGRQAAVCPHAVLDALDAPLFPLQIAGLSRGQGPGVNPLLDPVLLAILSPLISGIIGIATPTAVVIAAPTGVRMPAPAVVTIVTPAFGGPAIIFQATDVPAGLVLHLVKPLPLPGGEVAVGPHPVLGGLDAALFPFQTPGFPRG
jgi:hypothetical protein